MATQGLALNTTNFSLDPASASKVTWSVQDLNNNPINISTGWVVKRLNYAPANAFNGFNNAIDITSVGTFTYGNGVLTWNVPNNNGITPLVLLNNYLLTLSNDAGATESVLAFGQFTWNIFNYQVP